MRTLATDTQLMLQRGPGLSASGDCGCGCNDCGGLAARVSKIIYANDPRGTVVFASEDAGLARRVIDDAGTNAYVEVTGVEEDSRGTLVSYSVQWYSVLNCRDFIAVWTNAQTGQLLGSSRVGVPDYQYFNLTSGTCTKNVKTRLNAPSDTEVQVQLWQQQGNTVQRILDGEAIGYATMSRPFYLDESTSVGGQEGDSVTDVVEDSTKAALSAVFTPVLTWAGLGLAAYVAFKNRDAIANAFSE